MSDNSIKKIYNEVFKQVYPQIKNCQQGVLYKAIQIIREEETSTEENTLEIKFNSFGIKSSNHINEDNKIISDLINELFIPSNLITQNVKDITRNFRNSILKNVILDKDNKHIDDEIGEKKYMEIAWIICVSIVLVGAVASRNYYLKKAEKKKNANRILGASEKSQSNLNPPTSVSPRKLKPADLCLVVLAKDISHLIDLPKSELDRDDISSLIDRASYFLCVPTAEGISRDIEQKLSRMSDEKILPDSNREVYVRIEINDGQNLIGEKIPYYLKSNLSSSLKGKIQEVFCIKNLYSLEKLIRI